jgi:hypothetical protein
MNHGAEFENLERLAVLADSPLMEEYRSAGLQQHCHCTEEKNGTRDHQSSHGSDDVKYSLSMPNVKSGPCARFSSRVATGFFRAVGAKAGFHSLLRWDPVQLWNTTHRCRLLFVSP